MFFQSIYRKENEDKGDFTVIVISKERPFSLRSFLISLEKYFFDISEVKVLICCTDDENKNRYEEIKSNFLNKINVEFIFETNGFKESFIKILSSIDNDKIMLCVDDQVFFRGINYHVVKEAAKKVNFFTLRFGKYSSYSYNLDIEMHQPYNGLNDRLFYTWRCKSTKDDFNYALSFDATIFDKKLLLYMARYIIYTSPNQLESYMNYCKYLLVFFGFSIGCLRYQMVINFVLNRVQTDNFNKSLGFTVEELNNLYDIGKYVAVDKLFIKKFKSSHADFGYIFKDIK